MTNIQDSKDNLKFRFVRDIAYLVASPALAGSSYLFGYGCYEISKKMPNLDLSENTIESLSNALLGATSGTLALGLGIISIYSGLKSLDGIITDVEHYFRLRKIEKESK